MHFLSHKRQITCGMISGFVFVFCEKVDRLWLQKSFGPSVFYFLSHRRQITLGWAKAWFIHSLSSPIKVAIYLQFASNRLSRSFWIPLVSFTEFLMVNTIASLFLGSWVGEGVRYFVNTVLWHAVFLVGSKPVDLWAQVIVYDVHVKISSKRNYEEMNGFWVN